MLHAQLVIECQNRGISIDPLPGHRQAMTRAQMIIRIRDDVERRCSNLTTEASQTETARSSTSPTPKPSSAPRTLLPLVTRGRRVSGCGRDGRIMNNSLFRRAASTITEAGGRAKTLLSRVMHTEIGLPRSDLVLKDDFDGITAGMSSYVIEI